MRVTDVGAQKIDKSSLTTYGIVIAAFQVVDKLGGPRFFQKTFLLADISMKVVPGMPFFTLSNVDVQFDGKELTWKTYTTKKALSTNRQVEIINQKEFAIATLDKNVEAFMMHVSSLGLWMTIHLARKAQLVLLLAKKITVPTNYSDFADVFSEKSANILPKRLRANEHAIELKKGKQLPYKPIYSLRPVELETLKIYIKIIWANGFIHASKSPASTPILFVRKPNSSFCWCVNYQRLNNPTIKNWYPLPLIGKSLNQLGQAKRFT